MTTLVPLIDGQIAIARDAEGVEIAMTSGVLHVEIVLTDEQANALGAALVATGEPLLEPPRP